MLPLQPGTKIALIGPLADNPREMVGSSSGVYRGSEVVTVRAALEAHASASGGSVLYAQGTQILSDSDAGFTAAEEIARQSDVIVLALGESASMSGEAGSRAELDLPGNQRELLERLAATGKPIVLLVFSGRPLVLTSAAQHAQAILEVWFPGIEAGDAIAHLLYGDVAPSGKLPMSFPVTVGQEPLYYNQFPTGRPANNADLSKPPGADSRFISRYIDAPNAALFPFGFGLSYHDIQLLRCRRLAGHRAVARSASGSRIAADGDCNGDEYRRPHRDRSGAVLREKPRRQPGAAGAQPSGFRARHARARRVEAG